MFARRSVLSFASLAAWVVGAGCAGEPPTAADVRGVGLSHFSEPLPGLYCSGQPTPEQFDALAKLGVRHVVQLRAADEKGSGWEEERAAAAGVQVVRLPIAGAKDFTRANAERLAAALQATHGEPVLLCCRTSNRVGALLALKAFHVDGKPAEEALALGKAAGMTSPDAVAAAMQK